jgi:hypothetical protein
VLQYSFKNWRPIEVETEVGDDDDNGTTFLNSLKLESEIAF